MFGHLNDVQKKVRYTSENRHPYVHCHGHRLNLVLVDVFNNVTWQKCLEYWNVTRHFIHVFTALYVLSTALARGTVSRTVARGTAALIN